MKVVCIIPARQGSKRIPGKNTKKLLEKPLIEYTLDAAIKSEIFDKIYISTDDEKMQDKIYKSADYEILIRNGFSDDQTTVQEALLGSLDQIEQKGEKYDVVVQLLATCPLRTSMDIVRAYSYFREKKINFLITSSEYIQTIQWALTNQNKPLFKDGIKMRSQDLQTYTCPNGSVWIAKISSLTKHKTFYGPGVHLFPIPYENGIDIDTMEDFERAEMIMKHKQDKKNFKSVEDVLFSWILFQKKLKKDELDIQDLEKETIEKTKHRIPDVWMPEIDDEIRKKQKISSKKRSYQRNVNICKNIEFAIEQVKNDKYFEIIELLYFDNKSTKEIRKTLKLTEDELNVEKMRLLKILEILLEV